MTILESEQQPGNTVLLVENNRLTREALVDILDLLGYRVLVAANGSEALVNFANRGQDINLMVCAADLPDAEPLFLFRILQSRKRNLRLLMMAPRLAAQQATLAFKDKVTWIIKPFTIDDLAMAICQALSERQKEVL